MDSPRFLTFSSGGRSFAISLRHVREIIACDAITRMPRVPAFVRGLVNLRGRVTPVVDLAIRFDIGHTPALQGCLIIVELDAEDERSSVALLVDAVTDILTLDDDDIEPPPRFGLPVDEQSVIGVASVENGFTIVLELQHVLAAIESTTLAEGWAR